MTALKFRRRMPTVSWVNMSRVLARPASTVIAVLLAWASAAAAEYPLAGKRLVLRQTATQERLKLVIRDAVAVPVVGGPDDPRQIGATLEILNPGSGEVATLTIPAAGWSVTASGRVLSFRVEVPCRGRRCTGAIGDPIDSEVRSVRILEGKRIKVRAGATGLTLNEPAQGRLTTVLTIGTFRYCAEFGGTILSDESGRFSARDATAPTACPPAPGSSTTSTSTTVTSTSQSTSSSSSSSSTTSTSSSTTSSTVSTCGGIAPLCGGSCPMGQTCTGLVTCTCQ